MQMLLECLADHAARQPGRPFLIAHEDTGTRTVTYGDLLAKSQAMAAALRAHALDGVVFIVLKPTVDLYPAFLGSMLAGLVPSFLPFPTPKQDPALYFSSHQTLFAQIRPACILTYADLVDALREVAPPGTPLLDIETLRDEQLSISSVPSARSDATALLQFSSGTTGLKKGVSLTFAQIAEQISSYAPVARLSSESVVVSWLPLYHDMGLFTGFLIPLSLGASIVNVDPFTWVRSPSLLLTLIEAFRGTHAWLPNFAFQHILATTDAEARFDLSSMVQLISCSEVVKPNVLSRFAARFSADGLTERKLRACYAMAEACFAVSQSTAGPPESLQFAAADLAVGRRPRLLDDGSPESSICLASNGPAIGGIEIAIAGASGRDTAPTTAVGEILLRGAFLFSGYVGAPEPSSAAIREGWYHTGDIGFLHDGALFVCGRLKELIIVHGRNVYCHDIEAIASAVAGVVPGRVVAIGEHVDATSSEELLLLAELEDDDPACHSSIRAAIKGAVFTHLELTPRSIEFVPKGWLVKTTSGKLSRTENLARLRRMR